MKHHILLTSKPCDCINFFFLNFTNANCKKENIDTLMFQLGSNTIDCVEGNCKQLVYKIKERFLRNLVYICLPIIFFFFPVNVIMDTEHSVLTIITLSRFLLYYFHFSYSFLL